MGQPGTAKVYKEDGGDRLVASDGGSIDIESGGDFDVESGAAFRSGGTDIAAVLAASLVGLTATDTELNKLDGGAVTNAELNKLAGATVTTAEINILDNMLGGVVQSVVAESGDDVVVNIQFNDADGVAMATPVSVEWYLASDAAGLDPQTVAHDGGIVIGTDGALIEYVANLSGRMISEVDGDVDVTITDAGAFTAYLVIVLPTGALDVSAVLTHTA